MDASGIPFHAGAGLFYLFERGFVFGELEVKFHDMPPDEQIEIIFDAVVVTVYEIGADVVQKLTEDLAFDQHHGKRDKPIYVPVSNDLVNDERRDEKAYKWHCCGDEHPEDLKYKEYWVLFPGGLKKHSDDRNDLMHWRSPRFLHSRRTHGNTAPAR